MKEGLRQGRSQESTLGGAEQILGLCRGAAMQNSVKIVQTSAIFLKKNQKYRGVVAPTSP
jgi:hypothetical protein